MRALVVDADWKPRKGYSLTKEEELRKRALCGSQVWCNPRFNFLDVPIPNVKDHYTQDCQELHL